MKTIVYTQLEAELQNRWQWHYKWYRKQNDEWDSLSNFIYKTESWEVLISKIKNVAHNNNLNKREFFNYAANRWYNFWHAVAIEQIFCEFEAVQPHSHTKDRTVDFFINGVPFDHKTSVFPKAFNLTLQQAKNNEAALIQWLYSQQSSQQRQHFKNRLFVVVYNTKGAHWKLKANITWLKHCISNFMHNFKPEHCSPLTLDNGAQVRAAIVWAVK